MKKTGKRAFPVYKARQLLEPGPIVLVSSAHKGQQNIMTMGWHTVMEFTPSLFGCMIAASNHSFEMIRKSKECVINIPAAAMIDTVIAIGNCSGEEVDKFDHFDLTAVKGRKVAAPLVDECFANFECRIHDTSMINKYNFFIFEIVAARVAASPKRPDTIHYHGQGIFTTDGKWMDKSRKFSKWKNNPTF